MKTGFYNYRQITPKDFWQGDIHSHISLKINKLNILTNNLEPGICYPQEKIGFPPPGGFFSCQIMLPQVVQQVVHLHGNGFDSGPEGKLIALNKVWKPRTGVIAHNASLSV